jgi:hypothetical protein
MVGLSDYLEIYTEHETFRFQTPESIDPERTNPHAMFVQSKVADVGASSPYIARTVVMAHDMLSSNLVLSGEKLATLMIQMHRVKETLLHCARAADVYIVAYEAEIAKVKESAGKRTADKRMLAYFPVVQDIDAKVTAFLIPARRAITEVCQVPSLFWEFKRQHSDPAHLLEKDLVPILGDDHRMVTWLKTRLPMIKIVIDYRNGQEHTATTKGSKLTVRNFGMSPTNQIDVPGWGLDGHDLTDIAVDLRSILDFLTEFAEVMLVACVDANLPEFPPMRIFRNEKPDANCPVGYVLQVDEAEMFRKMRQAGG